MRTMSRLHWNPKLKCWEVLHSGVKYIITARKLQAPETKAGSESKAREWWTVKQTELDATSQPPIGECGK